METQKKQSGFGIASLVLGIISIITACFMLGIIPGILGIIFAIVGLCSKNRSAGTAIGGLICSIIGVIIFGLTLLFADIFSTDTANGPKKVSQIETSQSSGAEELDSEDLDRENSDNDLFKVGDVVETDGLKISFISSEVYVSDNEFIQPKSGCSYYRLEFEFENIGDTDGYVSSYDWDAYADGYAIDQTWVEDDDLNATISPGKKAKGAVYFEVPDDSVEVLAEYELNAWTEEKVTFKIK